MPGGLIEAKTLVPRVLGRSVARARLMRRLRAARGSSLVVVLAPAGYGKTSLLAQWASAGPHPAAWLTIDRLDNDPATFLTYLAAALDRVLPIDSELHPAIQSRAVPDRAVVGRLLGAMAAIGGPIRLAIDDAHRLTHEACLDALAEFVAYLPANAQVAIAGRTPPQLPLDRWRLAGLVVDVGPDDLAMDEHEAGALTRKLGLSLPLDTVEHLTKHTHGWPALLALALASARRPEGFERLASPHSSPETADYLRSELLANRPREEIEFLTHTSVLERLTGPLCDALLGCDGSSEVLAGLARTTLLVDEYGGWYRYHPILRSFLRDELEQRRPGLIRQLHRRAAGWFADAGDLDAAAEHAFATDDLDFAAGMVGQAYVPYHWSGRRATLQTWMQRFSDDSLAERPWLAVLAAYGTISEGDVKSQERYADLADRGSLEGRPPDGTVSLESGRALLRALMGRHGAEAMLADASRAVRLEAGGGRWHDFALWVQAVAHQALGDSDAADTALVEAAPMARTAGSEGLAYCIIGHRALLAADRGAWDAVSALLEEARSRVPEGRYDGYVSAAMARLAAMRLTLHEGDTGTVRRELARMASLRPSLTAAVPTNSVIALLGLARLHLAIADPAGARSLLLQADEILRLRRDLGVLPGEVAALRATLSSLPIGLAGASTLTAAELRVLGLLPYYLSFKEIGQRLGVKATTIKTHALSIYGKLGATSRSEAVELAVEAGLLEPFPRSPRVSAIAEEATAAGIVVE